MPIGVHPTEMQLLLDLYFRRSLTDVVDDWAAPHHHVVRNPGGAPGGPAWTDLANDLTVLEFVPGTPDWLECAGASCADLDFVAGDFSLAAWVHIYTLSANRMVMCRGLLDTDGWYFGVEMTGEIFLYTNQVGGHQVSLSAAGDITILNWLLIGATRSGDSVQLYRNGVGVTDTVGVHTNPITSARDLHIGIYDNETGSPFDGMKWRPRIWGRELPASEMLAIFEMERGLFGV